MLPRCCFISSTTALNCVSSSAYGSVIWRSGRVFIRYSAPSAMDIGESCAVILPACGEPVAKTASHDWGAGVTTSVRHISRLAPRPCGTPYAVPSNEFQGLSFSPSTTSA